jgi:hypothetical protein
MKVYDSSFVVIIGFFLIIALVYAGVSGRLSQLMQWANKEPEVSIATEHQPGTPPKAKPAPRAFCVGGVIEGGFCVLK